MSVDAFHLNRPVHLARRDVFFEQAWELIEQLPSQKNATCKHSTANKAQALFKDALHHALAANQSQDATDEDLLFANFLYAAVDNTQSIAQMLRRQRAAESALSPLTQFLGSADTEQKMANHYRRCAAHILKGMLQVLPQIDRPYRQLQHSTFSSMTSDNRIRYEKARKHLLHPEED